MRRNLSVAVNVRRMKLWCLVGVVVWVLVLLDGSWSGTVIGVVVVVVDGGRCGSFLSVCLRRFHSLLHQFPVSLLLEGGPFHSEGCAVNFEFAKEGSVSLFGEGAGFHLDKANGFVVENLCRFDLANIREDSDEVGIFHAWSDVANEEGTDLHLWWGVLRAVIFKMRAEKGGR